MDESLPFPISSADDIGRLAPEDRRRLTQWLRAADEPVWTASSRARRRRLLILLSLTVGILALVPWVAYLAIHLPDDHSARLWRATWVGFDCLLIASLLVTAWAGWRRRQIVVGAFLVSATLLICDAWFDVTLSWQGGDQRSSLATALLVELPSALILIWLSTRLLRTMTAELWRAEGRPGQPPALRRVPLLVGPIPPKTPG